MREMRYGMKTSAPIILVLKHHTATLRYAAATEVMNLLTCSCMCLLAMVVNSHTVIAVMAVNSMRRE